MSANRRSVVVSLFFAASLWLPLQADDNASPTGTLVPVRGAPASASLKSIHSDLSITLTTGDGPKTLASHEFIRWGMPHEPRKGPFVLLADGGLLVGDVVAIDDERLLLASDLWAEVSLPIELVRGVVFWPPPDRRQRDQLLDRLRHAKGQSDQILLENGDIIDGALIDLTDDTIHVEVASSRSQVPLERVTALIFDPSLAAAPRVAPKHGLLGFRDGTRLTANEFAFENGRLTVRLPGDVPLTSAADLDVLAELVLVMSLGPHVTYLSDLTPLDYKHIPYLGMSWDQVADRNVLGGRLSGGGRWYTKGLGMHSTSRLAYALDRPYDRFAAELAIDDATRGGGSVVFRVLCDATEGGWRESYRSPIIRGGDAPLPIDIDLTGAKRLILIVEFADRGDQLDHANWLAARLIPTPP